MPTSQLLENNANWVDARLRDDPTWFEQFRDGQAPSTLWIGCADSRVPPEVISGSGPGELFVHRNIANIVHPGDLSMMSVLQYAVQVLHVQDIVVCGHIHCGGVAAAVDGADDGLLDHWLTPIFDLAHDHPDEGSDREKHLIELVDLNVRQSVTRLVGTRIVRSAWTQGATLSVHGWVYDPGTGRLRDLECSVGGPPTS